MVAALIEVGKYRRICAWFLKCRVMFCVILMRDLTDPDVGVLSGNPIKTQDKKGGWSKFFSKELLMGFK